MPPTTEKTMLCRASFIHFKPVDGNVSSSDVLFISKVGWKFAFRQLNGNIVVYIFLRFLFRLCKRLVARQTNCRWPTVPSSMRRSNSLNSEWDYLWKNSSIRVDSFFLYPTNVIPLSVSYHSSPCRHVTVRNLAHKFVFTLKKHPSVNAGTIAFSLPQVGFTV